jgi:RNA polymerase sigma factor (sigma-70 family)
MTIEPGAPADEQLMERLQGGEDASLAPLMQRWEIPVKRFIFRLVGSSADADDLAQEVFVRVFLKRGTYRAGSKFSTWLFAIAANQAKNRLRWWKRRPILSLHAWLDEGGDQVDEATSPGALLAEQEKNERIAAIQQAVSRLALDERTALVLFEYEDKSMAEIAAILGCSAKAVENRLYRARRNLRRQLRPPVPAAGGGAGPSR